MIYLHKQHSESYNFCLNLNPSSTVILLKSIERVNTSGRVVDEEKYIY